MSAIALVVAAAGGVLLARRLTTSWLIAAGAGIAIGLAFTSVLFFFARIALPRLTWLPYAADAAWLGASVLAWRTRPARAQREAVYWPGVFAVVLASLLAYGVLTVAWDANPQGGWDAWAIWNLRAKFLAGTGESPRLAYSPLLTATHPEYPMLVSASVGRLWFYEGNTRHLPAQLLAMAFLAVGIITLAGALRAPLNPAIAILAALLLLANPALLHETAALYADVPLAMLMVMAGALLVSGHSVLAGMCAGAAAWTKNEGLAFLALFLFVAVVLRRSESLKVTIGAAPFLTAVGIFAGALAPAANPPVLGPNAPAQLADFSRYAKSVAGLYTGFGSLGSGWYHPILALLVFAAGFGLSQKGEQLRNALQTGLLAAGMTFSYVFAYVVSPNDLEWQIGTTAVRLAVQVWPLYLLTVVLLLRAEQPVKAPARAKRAK